MDYECQHALVHGVVQGNAQWLLTLIYQILWKQQPRLNLTIPIQTLFFTELNGTVFQLPYNLLYHVIILCMSAH